MGRFESVNDGARWALGKSYVESGAVEYSIAPLSDIYAQTPGTIHRADNDFTPTEKPKWQQIPDEGASSIAFGMRELLKSSPYEPKLETEKTIVFLKALTASTIPSSLFSGKMQLWIQAMYGARPEKWKLQLVKEDNAVPYLVLIDKTGTGRELYFDHGRVCGIVTNVETLEYFLVSVENDKVKYSRLVLSPFAKGLAKYVLSLGALPRPEMDKWEAYLLSDARIEKKVREISFSALVGTTVGGYNSWAFNWQGTKARIVTHEQFAGEDGKYNRRAHKYELSFSFNPSATEANGYQPLTASLETIETTEYQIRPGSDLLWYYDYIINLMITVTTPLNVASPYGDAPIYIFSDKDGNWIETRYSYSSTTLPEIYMGPVNKPILCAVSDGPLTYSYEAWGGTAIIAGFYNSKRSEVKTSGQTYRNTVHSLSVVQRNEAPLAPIYSGSNYQSTQSTAPPGSYCLTWGGLDHSSNGLDFEFQTGKARYVETDENSSGIELKTLLLLPQNDVSSVYIGSLSHRMALSRYLLDNTVDVYINLYAFKRSDIGAPGYTLGGLWVSLDSADTGYYEPPATGVINSDVYEISIYLVDRAEAVQTTDKIGYSYFDDVGVYASFFYPPLNVDPTNDIIYRVNHDLNDDCAFIGDIGNESNYYKSKGDYLYYPSCCYVGWA